MSLPDHGGRLELRLESQSPENVRYALALFTPEGEWQGQALTRMDSGKVELSAWATRAPPVWLEDFARAVVRGLWRGHASAGWPRRVTRWRAEPTSGPAP